MNIFTDGGKDFDGEESLMQEDHQPQDGGLEVAETSVHNYQNEVDYKTSEGE